MSKRAAEDGSFGRSAAGASARGLLLILAAVVIGVLLLRSTDAAEPFEVDAGGDGDGGEIVAPAAGDDDAAEGTTTTTAPLRDPSQVTVLVANGTSIKGAAKAITDQLKAANYKTLTAVNTRQPVNTSMVYFRPGYEAEARAVAELLKVPPQVAPMPDPIPVANLGDALVLIVMAADLAS